MPEYKKKQYNVDTLIVGMGLEPIPWWGDYTPQDMKRCPDCGNYFEPCSLCRGQYSHQSCISDNICHGCTIKKK
ncbi:hypothetical protein JZU46_00770 [bacterium]|nr:hypothetical protein [bacterium]